MAEGFLLVTHLLMIDVSPDYIYRAILMKPLLNINTLIGKSYNSTTYHCYDFIEECLNVPHLKDIHVDTVKNDIIKYKNLFCVLKEAEDYSIALLGDAHIGIYFKNGIYHNDTQGVRYEPLRTMKLKYKDISYHDIRTN